MGYVGARQSGDSPIYVHVVDFASSSHIPSWQWHTADLTTLDDWKRIIFLFINIRYLIDLLFLNQHSKHLRWNVNLFFVLFCFVFCNLAASIFCHKRYTVETTYNRPGYNREPVITGIFLPLCLCKIISPITGSQEASISYSRDFVADWRSALRKKWVING